jgi:hypothetical protein
MSSSLYPFAPEETDNPLVGCWQSEDGKFILIFLADGRAASNDHRPYISTEIRIEVGTYVIQDGSISFFWLLSDPETVTFSLDDNALTLSGSLYLQRIEGADEAIGVYEQIYNSLVEVAEASSQDVALASVQPGPIEISWMIPDPQPDQIFEGAMVFGQTTRYQWLLRPIREHEKLEPNEPGFTCCSYTFLPNGRFCFDGWLYGILVDDSLPFDPRVPVQV